MNFNGFKIRANLPDAKPEDWKMLSINFLKQVLDGPYDYSRSLDHTWIHRKAVVRGIDYKYERIRERDPIRVIHRRAMVTGSDVGWNTTIGEEAVVKKSKVGADSTIGNGASVIRSKLSDHIAIGNGAKVVKGSEVLNNCTIGEEAVVEKSELYFNSTIGNGASVIRSKLIIGAVKIGNGAKVVDSFLSGSIFVGARSEISSSIIAYEDSGSPKIGEDCRIDRCEIKGDVAIGNKVLIHENSFIGNGVVIGSNDPRAKGVTIGEGCNIQSGNKIPDGAVIPPYTVMEAVPKVEAVDTSILKRLPSPEAGALIVSGQSNLPAPVAASSSVHGIIASRADKAQISMIGDAVEKAVREKTRQRLKYGFGISQPVFSQNDGQGKKFGCNGRV